MLARRAQGGERQRAELQAACELAQAAERQRQHEAEQLRRKLDASTRKLTDAEGEARQAEERAAELAAALETAEREGAALQAEAARLGDELGAISRKAADLEKALGSQQAGGPGGTRCPVGAAGSMARPQVAPALPRRGAGPAHAGTELLQAKGAGEGGGALGSACGATGRPAIATPRKPPEAVS